MSTDKPLTILLLTSSYPRNKPDNSSIFLRYLAKHLAQQGSCIHVLAPNHKTVEHQELDSGVKTHWFKYLPKKWQTLAYGSGILPNLKKNPALYLQVPFFLIAMFFNLFFLCRKIKPDVIHAHWIIPQGFIAVIVGKLLNIPVVATAHGGDAFSLNNGILSQLKKITIRHCKAWTSNTAATAHAFGSQTYIPKPTIIPMGVDFEHFQSGNADKVLGKETRKIILFVGRLVEKKGVKYLIEAFAGLPIKTQKESVLWIIGDGDERIPLENQSNNLNIENIKFWGQVQNGQLPDFYAAASIFVAPSIMDSKGDTEGQGVILLEAMTSKTPIVATTVGGIPEVINNNKTGLLVQPNHPKQLSDAILRLHENESFSEELSENARQIVINTYDWKIIANNFVDVFKTCNKKNHAHRDGFSATTNRTTKAKKILAILGKRIQLSYRKLINPRYKNR